MQESINFTISRTGIKLCISRHDRHEHVLQTNLGNTQKLPKLSSQDVRKNSPSHTYAPAHSHLGTSLHTPKAPPNLYKHIGQDILKRHDPRKYHNGYTNAQYPLHTMHRRQITSGKVSESIYFGDTENNNTSDDYFSGGEKVTLSSDYDADDEDFIARKNKLVPLKKNCKNLFCILLNNSDERRSWEEDSEYSPAISGSFTESQYLRNRNELSTSIREKLSGQSASLDKSTETNAPKDELYGTNTQYVQGKQNMFNIGSNDMLQNYRIKRSNPVIPHLALLLPMMDEEDSSTEYLPKKLKRCKGSRLCLKAYCHSLGCYATNEDSHETSFIGDNNNDFEAPRRTGQITRLNNKKHSIHSDYNVNADIYNTGRSVGYPSKFLSRQRESNVFKTNPFELSRQHTQRGHFNRKNTGFSRDDSPEDTLKTDSLDSSIQSHLRDCAQRLREWFNMRLERRNSRKTYRKIHQHASENYEQRHEPTMYEKKLEPRKHSVNRLQEPRHNYDLTPTDYHYPQREQNANNLTENRVGQRQTRTNMQQNNRPGSATKYDSLLAPQDSPFGPFNKDRSAFTGKIREYGNGNIREDFKSSRHDLWDNGMKNAGFAFDSVPQNDESLYQSSPEEHEIHTDAEKRHQLSKEGERELGGLYETAKDIKSPHQEFKETKLYKQRSHRESNNPFPYSNANKFPGSDTSDSGKLGFGEFLGGGIAHKLQDIYKKIDSRYEFSAGQWINIKPIQNSQISHADIPLESSNNENINDPDNFPVIGLSNMQPRAGSDHNENDLIGYTSSEIFHETDKAINKSIIILKPFANRERSNIDLNNVKEINKNETLHIKNTTNNTVFNSTNTYRTSTVAQDIKRNDAENTSSSYVKKDILSKSTTEMPKTQFTEQSKLLSRTPTSTENTTPTTTNSNSRNTISSTVDASEAYNDTKQTEQNQVSVTTEPHNTTQDQSTETPDYAYPDYDSNDIETTSTISQSPTFIGNRAISVHKQEFRTWEISELLEDETSTPGITSVSLPFTKTETYIHESSLSETTRKNVSEARTATDELSYRKYTTTGRNYSEDETTFVRMMTGLTTTQMPSTKHTSVTVGGARNRPEHADVDDVEPERHHSTTLNYRSTKFASEDTTPLTDSSVTTQSSTSEDIVGILHTLLRESQDEYATTVSTIHHNKETTFTHSDELRNSVFSTFSRKSTDILSSSMSPTSEVYHQLSSTESPHKYILQGRTEDDQKKFETQDINTYSKEFESKTFHSTSTEKVFHISEKSTVSAEEYPTSLTDNLNMLSTDKQYSKYKTKPIMKLYLGTASYSDEPLHDLESLPQSTSVQTIYPKQHTNQYPEYTGNILMIDQTTGQVTNSIPVTGRLLGLRTNQETTSPYLTSTLSSHQPHTYMYYSKSSEKNIPVTHATTTENELLYPEDMPETTVGEAIQFTRRRKVLFDGGVYQGVSTIYTTTATTEDEDKLIYGNRDGSEPDTPNKPYLIEAIHKPLPYPPQTIPTFTYTDILLEDNLLSNNTESIVSTQTPSLKPSIILNAIFNTSNITTRANELMPTSRNVTCRYENQVCKAAEYDVYSNFVRVMLRGIRGYKINECLQNCSDSKLSPECDECIKSFIKEQITSDNNVNNKVNDLTVKSCPPQEDRISTNLTSSTEQKGIYNKCKYKIIGDLTSLFGLWLRAISNSR